MKKRLSRSEVPVHLTWNLDDIFPSVEAWENELKAMVEDIPNVTKYSGTFAMGPKYLFDCLEAAETLQKRLFRVVSYASLKQSGDGTDPLNQAQMSKASSLSAKVQGAISFIRSEALSLPEGTLERYLQEDPSLRSFERLLTRMIDDKPYMLHPQTEMALASLGEVLNAPFATYSISKASDMTFDSIRDSQGATYPMSFALYEEAYEKSADHVLRHNAFKSFTKGLKKYQNTYGSTWATEVKKHVVTARLRKYSSATHMLLLTQEVPLETYHAIHDIILKEIAPHMRRYAKLRKKVLSLDKLLYCDIEAPLDPDFNPPVTFAEGSEYILKGLEVLGPEYS
ncbi:MAG: oligoendopeptidase F, partial [bacterium]|nr:oligoendopeptidase F [bacterium]